MADVISQQLRREIRARAGGRCEYCLMAESLLVWGCEVDHILSRKHGGATESSNLALSCARCNRAKGTDIGSVHPESEALVRLFNPRRDRWDEHFRIDGSSHCRPDAHWASDGHITPIQPGLKTP